MIQLDVILATDEALFGPLSPEHVERKAVHPECFDMLKSYRLIYLYVNNCEYSDTRIYDHNWLYIYMDIYIYMDS